MSIIVDAMELSRLEERQAQVLFAISGLCNRTFGHAVTDLELRQVAIAQRISSLCHALQSAESAELDNVVQGCIGRGEDSVKPCGEFRGAELNGGTAVSRDVTEYGIEGKHPQVDDDHLEGGGDVEKRLTRMLAELRASFSFKRVPSDYYGRPFEERRDLLGAASIDHLCKSIVMVNTQSHESLTDCSNRNNSKYYVVVVQYTARLNAEKVRHFVSTLNNGKIPKKRFNFRLAPEEISNCLTGFEHNAVTPFGMLTNIPVIISDSIVKLEPDFFWLGGGEVDLKLGIKIRDFMNIINPFVADCTY